LDRGLPNSTPPLQRTATKEGIREGTRQGRGRKKGYGRGGDPVGEKSGGKKKEPNRLATGLGKICGKKESARHAPI